MRTFIFTIDTEWAPPEVLRDTLTIFEEHSAPVTLFCTDTPHVEAGEEHEIALHPNITSLEDAEEKIRSLHEQYPQAKGIRNHTLFCSASLHGIYEKFGLRYQSNFLCEEPFTILTNCGNGVLSLPIFYMDYVHIANPSLNPSFHVDGFDFFREGVYLFAYHPVITFINCRSEGQYVKAKKHYHDPNMLRSLVNTESRGVRDLLDDILSLVRREGIETLTCLQLLERYAHSTHQAII